MLTAQQPARGPQHEATCRPVLPSHPSLNPPSQAANGSEPRVTWPSGLVAPLMDEGEPHCADYIYVWEAPGSEVQVTAARLAGDMPSPSDATLYPSDHFGLQARLAVARRGG
jgi:hypothetical protein